MQKQVSMPVIVAAVVVIVILVLGVGWFSINREPPLRGVENGVLRSGGAAMQKGGKPIPGQRGVDVP